MLESVAVSTVAPLVSKLPYLDLSGIFEQPGVAEFIDFLSSVSYFFPWGTVLSIVGIMISVNTIRLIMAFLKALWAILPLV